MTSDQLKQLSLQEFNAAAQKIGAARAPLTTRFRRDYGDILEEVREEPFTNLLDAGCGTGTMLSMLQKALPDGQYTGLDFSQKMIDVARSRHIYNTEFVVGDCEALPFPDESFDVVTCSQSFHHYPNPLVFFQNIHRVLSTSGRLILQEAAVESTPLLWLVNHVELPLIHHLFHRGGVHMYSGKELQALCDRSGLILEKLEYHKGMRMHCVIRKA